MKYIYFSAPWCGPCKTLAPTMETVASQLTVEKINVDENQEMLQKYSVRNVPTVILTDNDGNEKQRFVGVNTANFFIDKMKEYEG